MGESSVLSRSVLRIQVKDRLLAGIREGRYLPGTRIVETRLARELGTSQGPVREALADLEALGLIETFAYKGARVCELDETELREQLELRSLLETLAGELVLGRREDVSGLIRLGTELERASDDGSMAELAMAHYRFHSEFVELSGSSSLVRLWGMLEATLWPATSGRGTIGDAAAGHQDITLALQRSDRRGLNVAVKAHFQRVIGDTGEPGT